MWNKNLDKIELEISFLQGEQNRLGRKLEEIFCIFKRLGFIDIEIISSDKSFQKKYIVRTEKGSALEELLKKVEQKKKKRGKKTT